MTFNFVLCPSYHGATLLSCLLSSHSQISSMGDTLPARKFLEKGAAACSCGCSIDCCLFWKKIIERLNPGLDYRDDNILPLYPVIFPTEMVNHQINKALSLFSIYINNSIWKLFYRQCDSFIEKYRFFYDLICDSHNTNIFVDGKKGLIKVSVFAGMKSPKDKCKIIHLFRDPRAVYYSHYKRNDHMQVKKFCKFWVAFHVRSQMIGRQLGRGNYFPLRYEELCRSPGEYLDSLQSFLGCDYESLPNVSSRLARRHIIGNVMLKNFNGNIELDTKWQVGLPVETQEEIVRLTNPLFSESGY